VKYWNQILRNIGHDIEEQFDSLRQRLEARLDHDPIIIQPYKAYGNYDVINLRGRVMQNNGITQSDRDTFWQNLLNTYRRFATDEIPYAVIEAQLGDKKTQFTADDEGFFDYRWSVETDVSDPNNGSQHPDVVLRLVDVPNYRQPDKVVSLACTVILPDAKAEYGIISDLDDTVIKSDVAHIVKLARNTFLQNSHTRLPFSGVAALYRALKNGMNGAHNPIFYVSSSPWNLHDLLTDFLELKQIPSGPLFLQDIGLRADQWIVKEHDTHKMAAIQRILSTYPTMSFVLIGDSTQHDAQIYHKIANLHSERIHAIYIRDVNTRSSQQVAIHELASDLAVKHGIPMLLVKNSLQAAEHAAALNFIPYDAVEAVRLESKQDDQPSNTIEYLTDIMQ